MEDERPFKVCLIERHYTGHWMINSTFYPACEDDELLKYGKGIIPLATERAYSEIEAIEIAFRHCSYYNIPITQIVMDSMFHEDYTFEDGWD